MTWRPILMHLAILIAYSLFIFILTSRGGEELFGRVILSFFAVGIHAMVLAILWIKGKSKEHLFSMLVVLLIGWSFCTSTFSI